MSVFYEAHSLTTEELRILLVRHREILTTHEVPRSITTEDAKAFGGAALVKVEGPEHWSFRSMGLTPPQAAMLSAALARPR